MTHAHKESNHSMILHGGERKGRLKHTIYSSCLKCPSTIDPKDVHVSIGPLLVCADVYDGCDPRLSCGEFTKPFIRYTMLFVSKWMFLCQPPFGTSEINAYHGSYSSAYGEQKSRRLSHDLSGSARDQSEYTVVRAMPLPLAMPSASDVGRSCVDTRHIGGRQRGPQRALEAPWYLPCLEARRQAAHTDESNSPVFVG